MDKALCLEIDGISLGYKPFLITLLVILYLKTGMAQPDRWQQRVEYTIDIDFDVLTHRLAGNQKLIYINNSPDTLHRIFYHLYFNAFQPGSMMDIRSSNIADPHDRIGNKISQLAPDEMGYLKIISLQMDGQDVRFEEVGTILECHLPDPILPGSSVALIMKYTGQVPVQIRRSGRNNKESIAYSMSQWYPKLCEYDYQGWHANPYIAREFYGVFGDFDVKLNIQSNYIVAASGLLMNEEDIGHGYTAKAIIRNHKENSKLMWHFRAENVHDFVWAADPDYRHTHVTSDDGIILRFFYKENRKTKEVWEKLPDIMLEALKFIEPNFGKYPYPQFSFIQAGDGGMEYPMATLITGERSLPSLVGVSIHEWMHTWYPMVLGSNESLYAWMDEGFVEYASARVMNHLRKKGVIPGNPQSNPFRRIYQEFRRFLQTGLEEPLSTHADHFITNLAYGVGSYTKGCIFLNQLEYIIGSTAFEKGLLSYYDMWKFKHPNANDFIRVMEKVSDMELDWYKEYFINTTHIIDYAINDVQATSNGGTVIELQKKGGMPMPIDIQVFYHDGSQTNHTIPLVIMRGEKIFDNGIKYLVENDWAWVNQVYQLQIPRAKSEIAHIMIDPTERLMDFNPSDNTWNHE